MKTLELNEYARLRVWLGNLPDAVYPSVTTITRAIAAGRTSSSTGSVLGALELFLPRGGRWLYGLVGGQWQPDATDQFVVAVNVSSAHERLFADSLTKMDEIRVGLPAEYLSGVMDGADLARRELGTLQAGRLSIDCAAHGTVGSAHVVYKHLSAMLIKLFDDSVAKSSDQDLLKMFPESFN